MKRPIDRYVDSLVRRRRPKPFAPTEEDLAVARTAIELAASGPDAQHPRETFITDLHRRLATQAAASDATHVRKPLGRRRFLSGSIVTATAAAAGVAGYELTQQLQQAAPVEAELTPTVGTWQAVASTADLPEEGSVVAFDLGSITGFVHRTSGRLQAVSGSCTHQGCRLRLAMPQNELACPCHGATFSVSGDPLTHPHGNSTLPRLPRLPVRVQGNDIQIYAPSQAAPVTHH